MRDPDRSRDALLERAARSAAFVRATSDIRDAGARATALLLEIEAMVASACRTRPQARFNDDEVACLAEIAFRVAHLHEARNRSRSSVFARLAALWREASGFERVQIIGVALAVPGALLALVTLAIVAAERI